MLTKFVCGIASLLLGSAGIIEGTRKRKTLSVAAGLLSALVGVGLLCASAYEWLTGEDEDDEDEDDEFDDDEEVPESAAEAVKTAAEAVKAAADVVKAAADSVKAEADAAEEDAVDGESDDAGEDAE